MAAFLITMFVTFVLICIEHHGAKNFVEFSSKDQSKFRLEYILKGRRKTLKVHKLHCFRGLTHTRPGTLLYEADR